LFFGREIAGNIFETGLMLMTEREREESKKEKSNRRTPFVSLYPRGIRGWAN